MGGPGPTGRPYPTADATAQKEGVISYLYLWEEGAHRSPVSTPWGFGFGRASVSDVLPHALLGRADGPTKHARGTS